MKQTRLLNGAKMKLPTYHLTWCDKIKAMFFKKHAVFYVNVENIVEMRNKNASFRVIASGLGLSQLDVKNIYYRSLGLKYKTEFNIQIPSEMSMLDSRVAKKLIKVGLNSKDKVIEFADSSDEGWIESISRIDGIGFKSAIDVCKWFLPSVNIKNFNKKCDDDKMRFLEEVRGIENVGSIRDTEDIDVPFDGDLDNPKYIEAIKRQKEIAKEIIKKEITL